MANHTSAHHASFRASLTRHLGGGAALVAVVAVAFFAIGQVGQQTPTPSAADVPQQAEGSEAPEPSSDAEDPDDAEEPDGSDAAEEPEPEVVEDEDDESADEGSEPEAGEAAEDEAAEDEAGDEEAAEDGGSETQANETAEPAFAPAEISLQVLDGVGTDGGSAASRVAQRLRDGGYDVVAENPALAYEATTVLWTSGNEAKARQVAAAIGAGQTGPQPDNLSESVDVHVVVGADRA